MSTGRSDGSSAGDNSVERYVEGDASSPFPPNEPPERVGWIWKALNAMLLVGVVMMLFTVGAQVASRHLGVSLPWTEELTRLLFQSLMFLGMAAGFRTVAHPRVALLVTRGPAWMKTVSAHVYATAGIAFFLVLLITSWQLMVQQMNTGESSPALGVRMYVITIVLIISCGLAILAHVNTVYYSKDMRKRDENGDIVV